MVSKTERFGNMKHLNICALQIMTIQFIGYLNSSLMLFMIIVLEELNKLFNALE